MNADTVDFADFEQALGRLPDGYAEGDFSAQRWGVTVQRSADARRIWLFGEELGGQDIVSFNYYLLAGDRAVLKPCEMSSGKVIDFVLRFRPSSSNGCGENNPTEYFRDGPILDTPRRSERAVRHTAPMCDAKS